MSARTATLAAATVAAAVAIAVYLGVPGLLRPAGAFLEIEAVVAMVGPEELRGADRIDCPAQRPACVEAWSTGVGTMLRFSTQEAARSHWDLAGPDAYLSRFIVIEFAPDVPRDTRRFVAEVFDDTHSSD